MCFDKNVTRPKFGCKYDFAKKHELIKNDQTEAYSIAEKVIPKKEEVLEQKEEGV